MRIPGGLAVVVGMHVDEAWSDDFSAGVDLPAGFARQVGANRGDQTVPDGDIAPERRGAAAVVNVTITDDEIVFNHGTLRYLMGEEQITHLGLDYYYTL